MKQIVLTLALLVFSVGSYAAQTLELGAKSGKVEFLAKGPLVRVNGKGPGATGKLTVADGVASGVLSLNLAELDTGISLRDDHMKNKYLEISKKGFDKALLKIKSAKLPKKLKGKGEFTGVMKLHGQTKPVKGSFKMKGVKGGKVQINAEFKLRFSDFKIPLPSFKLVSVGEEISIKVSAKADVKN